MNEPRRNEVADPSLADLIRGRGHDRGVVGGVVVRDRADATASPRFMPVRRRASDSKGDRERLVCLEVVSPQIVMTIDLGSFPPPDDEGQTPLCPM